jgi:hypothetical protein
MYMRGQQGSPNAGAENPNESTKNPNTEHIYNSIGEVAPVKPPQIANANLASAQTVNTPQPTSDRNQINTQITNITKLKKKDEIDKKLNAIINAKRKDTLSQLLLKTYNADIYDAAKVEPAKLTADKKIDKAAETHAEAERQLTAKPNYVLLNMLLPKLKDVDEYTLNSIIASLKIDITGVGTGKLNNDKLKEIKSNNTQNYDNAVKAKAIIDYLKTIINKKKNSVSGGLKGGYLSPAIIRGRRHRGTKRWLDPFTHIHPKGPATKKEYQIRPDQGTKRRSIPRPKYQTLTRKLLL